VLPLRSITELLGWDVKWGPAGQIRYPNEIHVIPAPRTGKKG